MTRNWHLISLLTLALTFQGVGGNRVSISFQLTFLILLRILAQVSCVKTAIDAFVHFQICQVKPQSSPWFIPAWSTAIANKNHSFRVYQHDSSEHNRRHVVSTRNTCKRVLKETKSMFSDWMKHRVAFNKFGSRNY